MQMPKRRSRMHRTPAGKKIEPTKRDFEIFKLLERYRYLRSTYIHAFVGGASETRFKERLGDLFHEGYLDRPVQQWDFARARYLPVVYENGAGATRILRETGITIDERRTFLASVAHRQFQHSLMICEVLASLELGVCADPRLRFIAWPQILERAPEQTRASTTTFRFPLPSGGYLVPDGLFGIEYLAGDRKTYRFFALEADRGTMPIARSNGRQTYYLAKLAAYQEIISRQLQRAHWGIPNLLVLTVTANEGHLAEILRRFEGQVGGHTAFLFKTVESGTGALTGPAPQLLSEPWQRAGLPPFRIDESD